MATLARLVLISITFAFVSNAHAVCMKTKDAFDRVCARDPKEDSACLSKGQGYYGWLKDSCIVKTGTEVAWPLLKDLDLDPALKPAHFARYKVDVIAKTLVYWNFQKSERPLITDEDVASVVVGSRTLYDQGYPLMAVSEASIPFIAQGGFRNLHQTGKCQDCVNKPELRSKVEDRLMRAKIETSYSSEFPDRPENRLRPKYAYGAFEKDLQGSLDVNPNIALNAYGNVYIAFKDRVKQRALIGNGDSLEASVYGVLNSPQVYSSGIAIKSIVFHTYYWIAKKLDFKRQFELMSPSTYYESQIWGNLTLDDVAYFLVNCPETKATDGTLQKTLKEHHLNIPVYECQAPEGLSGGRVTQNLPYAPYLEAGKRLYP